MSVNIMLSVICLSGWISPSSSMIWKLSNVSIPQLQSKYGAFIGYYNKAVQILGGYGSVNDLVEFPLDGTWNNATTTTITFGYQYSQSSIQIDAQLWMLPENSQYLNVFDLNTKSIIKKVSFPLPLAIIYGCVTSYNEYIFIIGGLYNAQSAKDFHIYNRLTTNWSTGTSLNNERYGHSCNVIDDTLYIIGGVGYNTVEYTNVIPLSNNTWTQITDTLGSVKGYHRSLIVSSLIYVIGGYYHDDNDNFYDQVDIIDTTSKTISSPTSNKLVYAKELVSTIVVDGYINVFGGYPYTDNIHYQYASLFSTQIATLDPNKYPTHNPTVYPTDNPTKTASKYPTLEPTTFSPSEFPSETPTESPSALPSASTTTTLSSVSPTTSLPTTAAPTTSSPTTTLPTTVSPTGFTSAPTIQSTVITSYLTNEGKREAENITLIDLMIIIICTVAGVSCIIATGILLRKYTKSKKVNYESVYQKKSKIINIEVETCYWEIKD